MASPVSAKSQPLHNFALPHLKWKNHRSGRSRTPGETSSSSPPPPPPPPSLLRSSPPPTRRPSPLHKQSPMRDSESESDLNDGISQAKSAPTKSADNQKHKGKRSHKICIRLREKSNTVDGNVKQNDAAPAENQSSTTPVAEEDELAPKTWNLRPRRPPMNPKQSNGCPPRAGGSPARENRTYHGANVNKDASEVNNNNGNVNSGKSKKQKFSISLTRDEIEEDILFITGSKPPRRPKKRPRSVQKQLDTIFPGLWLGSITADSYKVTEAPPKG